MATVYREARVGTLKTGEATKLIYILRELRDAIDSDVIERRLDEIAERLKGRLGR